MKSLSRQASYGEVLLGLTGALLFWILDAVIKKFLIGCELPFLTILFAPGLMEFATRLLATALLLLLVLAAAWLIRRKEDSLAQLEHGRFLLEEMAIELGHKNEKLSAEITRRKAIEERLATLADTDELTGIYNRRKFDELLGIELRQEPRYQRGLSLMMLDIDHFKEINDRYGHAVGDEVLKELAYLVEDIRREADTFFRVGGEEFCLITFASNGANLETACEKIRKAISAHAFETIEHLTVSVGATQFKPGDSRETLCKRTDDALYKAKQSGRDRVVIG
ncbi:GGDEF domain-containing protein [Parasulfuritortus cantonensis]|uniref:diguanylate cyclase n=1 Tax=Parasulfuritortus cantonensis TaxID=2528202 RepID=A0A4R1B1Y3_9PROT|nr:GGDEF domain-containing protein [Parasulfuritortus cantonensis]TCJ11821.1 GGDEF domain-containing protein [Parasulfuritortus cantonensis]